MNRFNEDELRLKLIDLFVLSRVAFAASCCERLMPHYAMFAHAVGWGDARLMRRALDEVWNCLESGSFNIEAIKNLIDTCDQFIPDTEDFTCDYTSAALDAGTSIVATLQCCLDGDAEHAVEVASFSRDTVDMYIRARAEVAFQQPKDNIEQQPLMIAELARQTEDLQMLGNLTVFDRESVRRFRKVATSRGSNLL